MCDSVTTRMDPMALERGMQAYIDKTRVGWVYAGVSESVDRVVTVPPPQGRASRPKDGVGWWAEAPDWSS